MSCPSELLIAHRFSRRGACASTRRSGRYRRRSSDALRVTITPASRVGKARRGADVRRAAAKARDARRLEAASARATRARARLEKARLKTPETREEVHSFHAKRRLLEPPYDPYEETPKASRRSLEAALEEEAVAARRVAEEEARAARWEERQKRQREVRAGERSTSACTSVRVRRRSAYFAPPRDLGRCLAPGCRPGPSGSLRRGPRAGPSSLV